MLIAASCRAKMNTPKLHHYVPQFYLRRFTDASGRLWAWDKQRDRIFYTSPNKVAAETQFYRLTQYEADGHDPLTMEKQLSELEGEVADITAIGSRGLRTWPHWKSFRSHQPIGKSSLYTLRCNISEPPIPEKFWAR
jgi:hypothetical protein